MGLEWVFLVKGDTVSYLIIGFIGWIVSYCRLDRILSYRLDQETLAFMRWLVTAWMGRMDWMGRWWDGRTLAPAGTGGPPLALEGLRAMGSGRWYQLRRGCKDAEYLCQRSIQIECTQIRTSNVVQDSIKITYDTIVLWLHITINFTYNINVRKKKSQKNANQNIEDSVRYKAE